MRETDPPDASESARLDAPRPARRRPPKLMLVTATLPRDTVARIDAQVAFLREGDAWGRATRASVLRKWLELAAPAAEAWVRALEHRACARRAADQARAASTDTQPPEKQ